MISIQLDIVIPNFNGKAFLKDCLASLQHQSFQDFRVIVVDNGSTDGSLELLRRDYPEVELIAWDENRGFSVAVNAGIAHSSAPLVFLLNNDTELDAQCLAELVRTAAEKPEFDFFAAKMLNYHDHSCLDGAGEAFLRGGVGYRLGTMEQDAVCYSTPRQVFGACAGAALYRQEFFVELGCFDEDFFAYLEDVDLNLRANSRGRKCWYVPEARVYHIGSATTGSKINPFTVRLSTRNNFCILIKNYPFVLLFRFAPAICVYQFFWLCFVLKKRQFGAYWGGIVQFIKIMPLMLAKRKETLGLATVDTRELGVIMQKAEDEVLQSIMRRRDAAKRSNRLFSLYRRLFL